MRYSATAPQLSHAERAAWGFTCLGEFTIRIASNCHVRIMVIMVRNIIFSGGYGGFRGANATVRGPKKPPGPFVDR